MQLQYVSITGADDAVDVADLSALAAEFPFVEWAIPFMPERAGRNRFPTAKWMDGFLAGYKGRHTAIHMCGNGLLGFIEGDGEILQRTQGFGRIQLNIRFANVGGLYDPRQLVERVRSMPDRQFILQYGSDTESLLGLFGDTPNLAVLFDESAGKGVNPGAWPVPLPGHRCGYAGGMNPDNVKQNIEMIAKAAPRYTTWIDMESGVRTDNALDLAKVRRVLETAAQSVLVE